jgi:hypothetical protein
MTQRSHTLTRFHDEEDFMALKLCRRKGGDLFRDGHHGSVIIVVVASSLGWSRAIGKLATVIDGST